MAQRRPKKLSNTQNTGFDWKSHPVIIASGSAAATFLLFLAVFTQLVAPTQTAKLEIELLKLKDSKEKTDSANIALKAKNDKSSGEIKALRERAASLQQELVEARAANLFSAGNPYPNGLGLVRIGMHHTEIEKVYSGQKIERNSDDPEIVTVYLSNSPFESVTFYLTDSTKSATIGHLSFDMPLLGSNYSENFLHNKLVENFGEPSKESTRKTFMWKVGTSYSLYSHIQRGYVLMKRGAEPVFWSVR